jgi:hypothetical protein
MSSARAPFSAILNLTALPCGLSRYLFPHQIADDIRRGFVGGYGFCQQPVRRQTVDGYRYSCISLQKIKAASGSIRAARG